MNEVELIKALPGGGTIVAFIVIVVLFLRHQKKIDTRVDIMTKMFSEQIRDFVGDMVQGHSGDDRSDQGIGRCGA